MQQRIIDKLIQLECAVIRSSDCDQFLIACEACLQCWIFEGQLKPCRCCSLLSLLQWCRGGLLHPCHGWLRSGAASLASLAAVLWSSTTLRHAFTSDRGSAAKWLGILILAADCPSSLAGASSAEGRPEHYIPGHSDGLHSEDLRAATCAEC